MLLIHCDKVRKDLNKEQIKNGLAKKTAYVEIRKDKKTEQTAVICIPLY